MMTYYFDFSVWKIDCDKFKQKQVHLIRNIIDQGRLSVDMEFDTYGLITFSEEDKNHYHPIITETTEFNRLKTNCLIYNLKETDTNKKYYDKLFIYQTNGIKTNGFYGFIIYNSETGVFKHKYYIDRTEDELARQLYKSFCVLKFEHS